MGKHTAFLAFGSNIGNGEENIKAAYEAIGLLPETKIVKTSSMHITKPWGYTEQADFTNSCAEVETELSPNALLGACLGIEAAMGRVRKIKNGPRIIDIDLLAYDSVEMNTKELVLPHPGMKIRDFVTEPMKELVN